MLRFVVLLHETPAGYARGTHFDFMLEHGGVLRTWALDKLPAVGDTVLAERLADHRLAYLESEGPIAGGRGDVRRVATGEYETLEEREGTLVVRLAGDSLDGTITLIADDEDAQRWRVSLSAG
jgi:hypothetical protein